VHQQLDAEVVLEVDDVFAHSRARQMQLAGGGSKAAVLHDLGEGLDAGELVHRAFLLAGRRSSQTTVLELATQTPRPG
jgi:hypothetical protein